MKHRDKVISNKVLVANSSALRRDGRTDYPGLDSLLPIELRPLPVPLPAQCLSRRASSSNNYLITYNYFASNSYILYHSTALLSLWFLLV